MQDTLFCSSLLSPRTYWVGRSVSHALISHEHLSGLERKKQFLKAERTDEQKSSCFLVMWTQGTHRRIEIKLFSRYVDSRDTSKSCNKGTPPSHQKTFKELRLGGGGAPSHQEKEPWGRYPNDQTEVSKGLMQYQKTPIYTLPTLFAPFEHQLSFYQNGYSDTGETKGNLLPCYISNQRGSRVSGARQGQKARPRKK